MAEAIVVLLIIAFVVGVPLLMLNDYYGDDWDPRSGSHYDSESDGYR